jgi:hypothetical protein
MPFVSWGFLGVWAGRGVSPAQTLTGPDLRMARLGLEPRTPQFSAIAPPYRPAVRDVAKSPNLQVFRILCRDAEQSPSLPRYPKLPADTGGFVPRVGVRWHKPRGSWRVGEHRCLVFAITEPGRLTRSHGTAVVRASEDSCPRLKIHVRRAAAIAA